MYDPSIFSGCVQLTNVGIHVIVYIEFADALLESGYPKCVKLRRRSHIACFLIFSDVLISQGFKGMSDTSTFLK